MKEFCPVLFGAKRDKTNCFSSSSGYWIQNMPQFGTKRKVSFHHAPGSVRVTFYFDRHEHNKFIILFRKLKEGKKKQLLFLNTTIGLYLKLHNCNFILAITNLSHSFHPLHRHGVIDINSRSFASIEDCFTKLALCRK